MKYSIPAKFFAILLTALALAVAVVSAMGIAHAVLEDLYTQSPEEWSRERVGESANDFAIEVLERTAIQQHSNATEEELANLGVYLGGRTYFNYLEREDYSCTVYDPKGTEVFSQGTRTEGMKFTVSGTVGYYTVIQRGLTQAEAEKLLGENGTTIRQAGNGTWFVTR